VKQVAITILALASVIAILLSGCAPSEEEIRAEEDKIVVTCAEIVLSGMPKQFYVDLAMDGIVFDYEEDPFGKHENYIQFKADYYRQYFEDAAWCQTGEHGNGWGRLPPADIMEKCGIAPPQE
jgi:hypothetical protein